MKAIVTGANGFVGSHLIQKLIGEGVEVLAIDLSFANSNLPKSPLIKKVELSIDNIGSLIPHINHKEYDLFYHFAWIGVNGPEKGIVESQLKNIELSVRCAEFASSIGVRKFLCSGTIAERNLESINRTTKVGPSMLYGAAKQSTRQILEAYCKSVGLAFVWMQFSNIYGQGNKTGNLISYTIDRIKKNEPAIFGPANQPYDFVYIDDLLSAVYLLGVNNTEKSFYFIGSGDPMILSDYLCKVGEIFRKKHLIRIGEREDDCIKYSFDMFDISETVLAVGEYVHSSFEENIKAMRDGK